MSAVLADPATAVYELPASATGEVRAILERAHDLARAEELPFPGTLPPQDAWALVQAGAAKLVDVRTTEERVFVGLVREALHVAWETSTARTRNPRFLKELEAKTGKAAIVVLLCRSGKRSGQAAEAAYRAGFKYVYNVHEGFEGDLDEHNHRGTVGGWRVRGLPWVQD